MLIIDNGNLSLCHLVFLSSYPFMFLCYVFMMILLPQNHHQRKSHWVSKESLHLLHRFG